MLTAIKRVLIFLCIMGLSNPSLYAQSEAMAPPMIPLPDQTTLSNVIPPGIVIPTVPAIIPPSPEKEAIIDLDKIIISLPLRLLMEGHSMQRAAFADGHQKKNQAFFDYVDKKIADRASQTREDRKTIREEWQKYLGIDIWYPYFKTKEIEDWLCDKTKVEVFHFKGRVKFENNQLKYTFKMRF